MAAAADDAARALLEARDDDGWSPLHYAANAGSAEVVAFLLASGADRLARDRWGAAWPTRRGTRSAAMPWSPRRPERAAAAEEARPARGRAATAQGPVGAATHHRRL